MLVQTDWTNIQDPSSFLPEFRSPFTLAPPLLGFRLCSVESVLQCLQSVPQVWIHGASSGPFHKSPQNWSDAEESHGKVSTKTRPKAVDVNQMTGSFVVGNLFPFLCLGFGLACAQSTRRIQFHIRLVLQVVLMKKEQGKVDQSFGGAILSNSFPKKVGWIWKCRETSWSWVAKDVSNLMMLQDSPSRGRDDSWSDLWVPRSKIIDTVESCAQIQSA